MHKEALEWVTGELARLRPRCVLEFGSRDVNGSARGRVPGVERWHGVDVSPGPGVDELADAARYTSQFKFDVVVCTEVLEHAAEAEKIVACAYEALRPGGSFVMTAACEPRAEHSAYDGGPRWVGEFYRNVDPVELARWLGSFKTQNVTVHEGRGDVYASAEK